ncbi:MAG: AbrB/MazE/SpoVT family DNA-binding domain-containing protein [Gammaproteobacteria bacterium]|nr:AbrB/MazE/SpoVT family DNA-binding domain-containing protein [Gammaproteobacteria bacterium]
MATANSRLTAQGQISVPAEIRRKLGLGPGAVMEWHEIDGEIVVRRAGRFTSADIRQAIFPQGVPVGQGPVDTKAALRAHARRRHAGR